MKLLKDLLYSKGNEALDIARLSAAVATIAYWAGVFVLQYQTGKFDPVEVGTGWGLVAAGNGGWIFARQAKEETPGATVTTTTTAKVTTPAAQPDAEIV